MKYEHYLFNENDCLFRTGVVKKILCIFDYHAVVYGSILTMVRFSFAN